MKASVAELIQLVGGSNTAEKNLAPPRAPTVRPSFNGHHGQATARKAFRHITTVEPRPEVPAIPLPDDDRVSSQKPLIAWDEAQMTTGVDSIDSQHQELIHRINELHTACVAGTAREELLKLLGFLGDYAQSHFSHEEGVMQSHHCPVRGKNKAAHVQFLRDYETLVEIVKRDGPSTTAVLQIKDLLGNWLKNHICAIDTKLRTCAGNGAHKYKDAVVSDRGSLDF